MKPPRNVKRKDEWHRRLEEMRRVSEEQLDRLELVAVDLLAEIRLARRVVQGQARKCKPPRP